MEARLEREIRRLPQVLACTITPAEIVVLVHPSADPALVEREIAAILESTGGAMPLRVLGEVRAPGERGRRRIVASRALIAALFGVGATVTISVLLPGPAVRPPSAAPAPSVPGGGLAAPATPVPAETPPEDGSTTTFSSLGFRVRVLRPAVIPELSLPGGAPEPDESALLQIALPPAVPPEEPIAPAAPPAAQEATPVPGPGGPHRPPAREPEASVEGDGRHKHGPVHRHPPVPGPHPHGDVHRHPPVPAGGGAKSQGGAETVHAAVLPAGTEGPTVGPGNAVAAGAADPPRAGFADPPRAGFADPPRAGFAGPPGAAVAEAHHVGRGDHGRGQSD